MLSEALSEAYDPPEDRTKAGSPLNGEDFHSNCQRTAKGTSGKGPRQKTSKCVKSIFRHGSTFFRTVQKIEGA